MRKGGQGSGYLSGRAFACGALLFAAVSAQAQTTVSSLVPTAIPTALGTPAASPASTAAVTPSGTPAITPAATPSKTPATKASKNKSAPGSTTKTKTLSATAYRAILQGELQKLIAIEKHPPRLLQPILDRLDATFIVKRADGKAQRVAGNELSRLGLELSNTKNAKRTDVTKVRQVVESEIKALDRWTATPYYQPADAQKIFSNLEKSGEIRTGPLWWQLMLSNAWDAVARAFKAFSDWLDSWLPKSTPAAPVNPSLPSAQWIWIFFYGVVVAILGAIIWFLWRAFGGKLGHRDVKRAAILAGEDAQLLLLPPEELRSRADIYASQGNFREALRHRYLGLLMHMDARGVWRYDTRRTNWEHIAALRRRERTEVLIEPLSALTRRFDRVRYGGAACDAEQWRQYDDDARQFEVQAGPLERSLEVAR